MRLPARYHPEFEPAKPFEYPTHLRQAIIDLPCTPGVYVFHGEEGDLPLYIGKSVNLRSRVLSHLRNPDEARLLLQTRRISYIRTAGEIGALLLESSLIKSLQPLMNKKLRRIRQLCSLRVIDGPPEEVYFNELDFASEPCLYGLFSSKRSAQETLYAIADQEQLCYSALGLEKLTPGRACFRAMLHQCAGLCRGDETFDAHHSRLLNSLEFLRVDPWPYQGAVALIERDADERQFHVIHNWRYLGSARSKIEARRLVDKDAHFDLHGYGLLRKLLQNGLAEIVLL